MALLNVSTPSLANCRRNSPRLAYLLLGLILMLGLSRPVRAADPLEYRVKAAFLFNFAQFVKWPPQAFPDPRAPLVIGILGDNPFGSTLDEIVSGEQVNGRSLVVRRGRKIDEIGPCHILFISRSEADRIGQILASVKGRNILTVADVESPAMREAMIRFATENNKIRLRINAEAAKAANLAISSKLLRAAETAP
jgi:hypothetical protein